MKTLLASLAVSLLLLLPFSASAENSTKIPGHTVHHNALTTDMLSPAVAQSYGIRRSKGRAMLNISVIQDVPGTTGKAVTAEVKAVARNLIGQSREIPLREIREGSAIYYIGDFQVGHREHLTFLLDVTPEGASQASQAKLEHEFYTN